MTARDERSPSFKSWVARPQSLIALSALLLSACGIFVAVYEATLVRRQQRASVWPYVEVAGSLTSERVLLWVRNTGVGPARIRAAAVLRDGVAVENWSELIRSVDSEPRQVGVYSSLIYGRVLPRDSEEETIFRVTGEDGPQARELVHRLASEILEGRVDVAVCYCSVFDDCWESRLQDVIRRSGGLTAGPRERPVESCKGAPRSGI